MEPLLLSIAEAAKVLGIGRSQMYRIVEAGELATVRVGRRRLVPVEALRAFVEQLSEEAVSS